MSTNYTRTMTYTAPAVVIDNGSYTTKAGFSLEDLPSLVFNSNYMKHDKTQQVIIGDELMENNSEQQVMKLLDDGLIYDFDNIVHNWQYVFDNVDNNNPINSSEFPLVVTEQPWNTSKNKVNSCQVAFETLQVPIFSLVKTPLAQLYRCGKSTGLVIDIGSSVTSVTPILDGVIQLKCSYHSKYAGDFVNLHVLNYLESKTAINSLLPSKFANSSESFKQYYISRNILQEYKNLSLNYQIKDYQLYNHEFINVSDQQNYLENLFDPTLNKLPNIHIPEPSIDKPGSHGLTNLVFLALKNLESTLLPQNTNDNTSQNRYQKFIEIFKLLLSNVLITGGTSAANGLPDHIILCCATNQTK